MTKRQLDAVLSTMTVLVDVGEQPSRRALERYKRFGCPYSRVPLSYGSYTYNIILPDGQWLYDEAQPIAPECAVMRMDSLDDLAYSFCRGREQFKATLEHAVSKGAKIYIVIENGSWDDVIYGNYKSKMSAAALFASITAYMARYNVTPILCSEDDSGQLIREILYRELKERMERRLLQ